ncbi:MAG: alanine--tRNA ligase [Bacteroidota bacterium]
MNSNKTREKFLEFFRSKGHEIVPSAPMVVKNDPTLMFINSGMAPFKDIFLGNSPIRHPRVADTQKCLRVSGKHNDLEEVGVDTYHHTMFEMLGNWSFGDYFKKEAIEWSWELLVGVYKIDPDRLYVTVFEGSKEDGLAFDQEAYDNWKRFISEDRILRGSRKDNFWEMGDTGPCGPCTEIHADIRDDKERRKVDGKTLVNAGHPQVIEIWNNVFMEFNRRADGSLEKLPKQHVDTGMGFERLCMVLQGKKSNYDTDIFQPIIQKIEDISGLRYRPEHPGKSEEVINIAMRVIADHIRAISFSIADGQLPSNTGAGYVIRRILRRAIRYGYQSLNLKEPFLHRLVPVLAHQMGGAFPELNAQKLLIEKVIKEEEGSFYRTLETGLKKIDAVCIEIINSHKQDKVVDGKVVFELYDTFGFPLDLTSLIARGYGLSIDEKGFNEELEKQKNRSREATATDTGDWIIVSQRSEAKDQKSEFVGYEKLAEEVRILKYRKVKAKNKELVQLVLDRTPFYAESGGQVGDTGYLEKNGNRIPVIDTKKEHGEIVHFTDKLPADLAGTWLARVNERKRALTENNHSATHLLHAALRKVLGTHVEQKGSLVNDEHVRFDFSHFSKINEEELEKIESMVNEKVRENIAADIREMPIAEAKKMGAMALFGEKYGDVVRVVTFDPQFSIELCGGTHVKATGQIGLFKIVSESAIAAGIRRVEAITSEKAIAYLNEQIHALNSVKALLKNPRDVVKSVENLIGENAALSKQVELLYREKAKSVKAELLNKIQKVNGYHLLCEKISLDSPDAIKDIAFELKQKENIFIVLGAEVKGKASLTVAISDDLVRSKNLDAGKIVRELAKEIQGGGGGQANYATAGGSNAQGIQKALEKAKGLI